MHDPGATHGPRSAAALWVGAFAVVALVVAASASPVGSARGKTLPLGGSFTFREPPDALKTKVLRLVDPASAKGVRARRGHRLVAIRVALTNVGGRILYPRGANCTRFGTGALFDGRRRRYASRKGVKPDLASFFKLPASPYVEARALVRGQTFRGYYTFEVPARARAVLFSFGPCRGAPSRRWRLR